MAFPSINPTETQAWKKLQAHFESIKSEQMLDWFTQDNKRDQKFQIQWDEFLVDYSKNRITEETVALLLELANESKLSEAIAAQFEGEHINKTEDRAVLHTDLRVKKNTGEVYKSLKQIKNFSNSIINGKWTGFTKREITDVVNIGIGGSDLGPRMVVDALAYYRNHLNIHFVSNVDGDQSAELLDKLDPETTLFIIVSKSFSTQETLTNAQIFRNWFLRTQPKKAMSKHFVAVSSNIEAVTRFGIGKKNTFPMWDWVGGRFSLWSSVGLSISLAVGYKNFEKLLEGAHAMDEHFKTAEFNHNIPVILGLLSVWYNNFFKTETEAIIPYTHYLERLVPYLQQAIMESNGKSVDRQGQPITYQTGNIVWGSTGTNAQHAFFQLIHQGSKLIPCDFIGFNSSLHGEVNSHDKLMANFFAQTQALMTGKSAEKVKVELSNLPEDKQEFLLPYKVFEGNKPTTTILIDQLSPKSLGSLIALYEHRIFVQGVIWNIFSYDQWGVELGKQLANHILEEFNDDDNEFSNFDVSTASLLRYYKLKNKK